MGECVVDDRTIRKGLFAIFVQAVSTFSLICCFGVGCRCALGPSRNGDRGGPYGYRSLISRSPPCSFSNGHRRTNTYVSTFSTPCCTSKYSPIKQTVSFLPNGQVALNLPTLIWRYVRQFVKMDGKEALQYVYTVTLNADQPGVGEEQVEQAWEMVRRIITLANAGPAWDELVGGFRTDGNKFVSLLPCMSNLQTHSVLKR